MKPIDFDQKFFEYAQGWIAMRPNLTDKKIDESYNLIMLDWLNAPSSWLGGATPGTYFLKYDDPIELTAMVEQYVRAEIGVPEPLYNRIVSLGEGMADALTYVLTKKKSSAELKGTVLGMLMDIDSDKPISACIDIVCAEQGDEELRNMAVEVLSRKGEKALPTLLERYPNASKSAQMLILDVACNFPGDERIYTYIIEKLLHDPDNRALYASYLNKLGDPRAIEPLTKVLSLSDMRYLDYIELRNAIEALGGDAGEERSFDGDPDYEAMRNM